jgi:hypothetical protein
LILAILGLLDIALGSCLAASPYFSYVGSGIITTLGIIALLKGLYSTLAAAASGFYFDLPGWLDLLVGLMLLLATVNIHFQWFLWMGVFMIAKGVYSVAASMVAN